MNLNTKKSLQLLVAGIIMQMQLQQDITKILIIILLIQHVLNILQANSYYEGGIFSAPITTRETALQEVEGYGSKTLSFKENIQNFMAGIFQVTFNFIFISLAVWGLTACSILRSYIIS